MRVCLRYGRTCWRTNNLFISGECLWQPRLLQLRFARVSLLTPMQSPFLNRRFGHQHQPPLQSPVPVARQPWPLWARVLAKRRETGDVGLGDTVARTLEHVWADNLALAWESLTGKSCGCQDRRQWLNRLYPYPQEKEIDLEH